MPSVLTKIKQTFVEARLALRYVHNSQQLKLQQNSSQSIPQSLPVNMSSCAQQWPLTWASENSHLQLLSTQNPELLSGLTDTNLLTADTVCSWKWLWSDFFKKYIFIYLFIKQLFKERFIEYLHDVKKTR